MILTLLKDRSDILVCCPGRLAEVLEQGTIDFKNVKMLVLDEADRMLDMGFMNSMTKIISKVPKPRLTVCEKVLKLMIGFIFSNTNI